MDRMPTRVAALFLALLMVWSGFGASEGVSALRGMAGAGLAVPASVVDAPTDRPSGTVEHHHLDDRPAQAQADVPHDLGAPLAGASRTAIGRIVDATRAHGATPMERGPWLEGLLRPPRPTRDRMPAVA